MRVKILKDDVVTNEACFSSQEEADSWLNYHRSIGSFGQEHKVTVTPEIRIQHEAVIAKPATEESEEVLGADAYEELIPEVIEIVEGFTAVCEDDKDATLQAEINEQALKHLLSTDWYIIRKMETGESIPEGMLEERQAARQRIVR